MDMADCDYESLYGAQLMRDSEAEGEGSHRIPERESKFAESETSSPSQQPPLESGSETCLLEEFVLVDSQQVAAEGKKNEDHETTQQVAGTNCSPQARPKRRPGQPPAARATPTGSNHDKAEETSEQAEKMETHLPDTPEEAPAQIASRDDIDTEKFDGVRQAQDVAKSGDPDHEAIDEDTPQEGESKPKEIDVSDKEKTAKNEEGSTMPQAEVEPTLVAKQASSAQGAGHSEEDGKQTSDEENHQVDVEKRTKEKASKQDADPHQPEATEVFDETPQDAAKSEDPGLEAIDKAAKLEDLRVKGEDSPQEGESKPKEIDVSDKASSEQGAGHSEEAGKKAPDEANHQTDVEKRTEALDEEDVTKAFDEANTVDNSKQEKAPKQDADPRQPEAIEVIDETPQASPQQAEAEANARNGQTSPKLADASTKVRAEDQRVAEAQSQPQEAATTDEPKDTSDSVNVLTVKTPPSRAGCDDGTAITTTEDSKPSDKTKKFDESSQEAVADEADQRPSQEASPIDETKQVPNEAKDGGRETSDPVRIAKSFGEAVTSGSHITLVLGLVVVVLLASGVWGYNFNRRMSTLQDENARLVSLAAEVPRLQDENARLVSLAAEVPRLQDENVRLAKLANETMHLQDRYQDALDNATEALNNATHKVETLEAQEQAWEQREAALLQQISSLEDEKTQVHQQCLHLEEETPAVAGTPDNGTQQLQEALDDAIRESAMLRSNQEALGNATQALEMHGSKENHSQIQTSPAELQEGNSNSEDSVLSRMWNWAKWIGIMISKLAAALVCVVVMVAFLDASENKGFVVKIICWITSAIFLLTALAMLSWMVRPEWTRASWLGTWASFFYEFIRGRSA